VEVSLYPPSETLDLPLPFYLQFSFILVTFYVVLEVGDRMQGGEWPTVGQVHSVVSLKECLLNPAACCRQLHVQTFKK
jgi:hypothetical protein